MHCDQTPQGFVVKEAPPGHITQRVYSLLTLAAHLYIAATCTQTHTHALTPTHQSCTLAILPDQKPGRRMPTRTKTPGGWTTRASDVSHAIHTVACNEQPAEAASSCLKPIWIADGQQMDNRNRVASCSCGSSQLNLSMGRPMCTVHRTVGTQKWVLWKTKRDTSGWQQGLLDDCDVPCSMDDTEKRAESTEHNGHRTTCLLACTKG